MHASAHPAPGQLGDSVQDLAPSFERSLLARNRAPKTISTYLYAVREFGKFLDQAGMPRVAAHVRREHVNQYITHLLTRLKPATAAIRYRSLQQLWRWAEAEVDPAGELTPHERWRRALAARRAYFARLALRSARARRRSQQALCRDIDGARRRSRVPDNGHCCQAAHTAGGRSK